MKDSILHPLLFKELSNVFELDLMSVHGPAHWMRVRKNGLMLAPLTGANRKVVELFAVFHDSCRDNDWTDPHHGPRAAALAEYYFYEEKMLMCSEEELQLLMAACEGHTYGGVNPHETIGTCWDADRLDLPRVQIIVDPDLLCTDVAKDPKRIAWAQSNAQRWVNEVKLARHPI